MINYKHIITTLVLKHTVFPVLALNALCMILVNMQMLGIHSHIFASAGFIVLSVVSIRLRVHYKVTFKQCSHLASTEIKYEHANKEYKGQNTCNCQGMKEKTEPSYRERTCGGNLPRWSA